MLVTARPEFTRFIAVIVSISQKSASKFSRFERENRRVSRVACRARSRGALVCESPAVTGHPVPPTNKSRNAPQKQAFLRFPNKCARAHARGARRENEVRIARAVTNSRAKNISKNPRAELLRTDFTSVKLRGARLSRRPAARSSRASGARVTKLSRASRACNRDSRARSFHIPVCSRRPPPTPSRNTSTRPARERWE